MLYPNPDSDALAKEIGYAISAWAYVEEATARLFDFLSGTDLRRSLVIFGTIVAFEARVQVVNNLMLMQSEETDENLLIWTKTVERVLRLYKRRHEIAHCAVVMERDSHSNEIINSVVPFYSASAFALGRFKRLSLKEVEERKGKFEEVSEALMWFFDRVSSRKFQHEVSQEPEPHLIHHLRTLVSMSPAKPRRLSVPPRE